MNTIAPLSEEVGTAAPVVAQWLRIRDAERAFGLCRSSLYSLLRAGKIRSVCLRPSNGMKGVRLLHAESLNNFILSQEVAYDQSRSAAPHAKNGLTRR
jgi:hypothetical protein